MDRQLNKFRDLIISSTASIPEDDPKFQLEFHEFPHDVDSIISVRQRSWFKARITFLPTTPTKFG